MADIGEQLRETRMRDRIDISELESQTKIRAKYLRALENEEWDLLPGPTFVKSFLRTYGDALGLDGKRLVDEYKTHFEDPRELDLQPISPPRRSDRARKRASQESSRRRAPVLLIAAVLVIALALALWVLGSTGGGGGGGGGGGKTTPSAGPGTATKPTATTPSRSAATQPTAHRITLQVVPTAAVYVCLETPDGHKLINGQTLQPGAAQPTYSGRQFLIVLGNGSATLRIDGTTRSVPQTGSGISYSITRYGRHILPAAQWPKCG
jgi:hypothetical protein